LFAAREDSGTSLPYNIYIGNNTDAYLNNLFTIVDKGSGWYVSNSITI